MTALDRLLPAPRLVERDHADVAAPPEAVWARLRHGGIEIEASAASVWPWVAQIGADRGGFYSYQWLENIVGCEVRNAEVIHPEWQSPPRDGLRLHPKMPALPITEFVPGSHFVAHAAGDARARDANEGFVETSWLFFVEPLGDARCGVISRFRAGCSDDVATRAAFGPALLEPIGFVMDRKMLEGIKARAERR